jgi:hypothetical protein
MTYAGNYKEVRVSYACGLVAYDSILHSKLALVREMLCSKPAGTRSILTKVFSWFLSVTRAELQFSASNYGATTCFRIRPA